MKKIDGIRLVAALFLLFGCVVNLLDLYLEIPIALMVVSLVLLVASVVLHVIVWRAQANKEKQEKNDQE